MKNPSILRTLIPFFFFFIITHSSETKTKTLITDYHKLVYTQCSNPNSPNASHTSLLSNLFQQFTAHSSQSAFFQTIVADEKTAISGSFQCRKDLSPDECRSCVSKFSDVSRSSCGESLPARIQLNGCYARYEEEDDGDEDETSGGTGTGPGSSEVLHRACSKRKMKRSGFEEMKYAAFAAVERCVVSESGFCEMRYESIDVLAQCEGSLRSCDCGECVNRAAEIGCEDEECRFAVSGEIYIDGCFIKYGYGGEGFGTYKEPGGDSSPKLVAIVVGGLAILVLGIGFYQFTKSCGKKKDDW